MSIQKATDDLVAGFIKEVHNTLRDCVLDPEPGPHAALIIRQYGPLIDAWREMVTAASDSNTGYEIKDLAAGAEKDYSGALHCLKMLEAVYAAPVPTKTAMPIRGG